MKFNIDTTIFIRLDNLNEREIFSICVEHDLVFSTLINCKNRKLQLYIDTKLRKIIATSTNDHITFMEDDNTYYGGLTKKEHDRLSAIKPIKVPKLKVNEKSIKVYKELNDKGYLRIDKFDKVINDVNDVNIDSILVEFGINGISPFDNEGILIILRLSLLPSRTTRIFFSSVGRRFILMQKKNIENKNIASS